ncbi:MAG: type II toxin-antitoxin system RelE/ParE family toxin [Chthoniobacterales bacterium]|nr:type II toxin-antitoxin system RelE/ParE family toxin [Chthoniobacterales bacterium]
MREILFYQTDSGDKPVEEFLARLAPPPRAKIVRTLEMLRTMPNVPGKFWQKMSGSGKLWEVRTEYGGNIYRILAITAKGNRVVLLHGFQKKSQKTPRQDMEIAQQRQKRYFERHGYL